MSDSRHIGGEAFMAGSVSTSSTHTARHHLEGEGEVPNPTFHVVNQQVEVPGVPTERFAPGTQPSDPSEMEGVVNHLKFMYDKMMYYVTKTKPAKLVELQALASRLAAAEHSLAIVGPESRQALYEIIEAQKAMGWEIEH